MSRVIGIDFSTTSTGIAIHNERGWSTYTVKSSGKTGDDSRTYYQRIRAIAANVLSIVQPEPDDVIAIEKAVVMGRRTDSEIRLHFAWHRFVECFLGWSPELPEPLVIPPATAKSLGTGNGQAKKKAMHTAVVERLGFAPRNADEADAVWIAIAGAERMGHRFDLVPLPPKTKNTTKGRTA